MEVVESFVSLYLCSETLSWDLYFRVSGVNEYPVWPLLTSAVIPWGGLRGGVCYWFHPFFGFKRVHRSYGSLDFYFKVCIWKRREFILCWNCDSDVYVRKPQLLLYQDFERWKVYKKFTFKVFIYPIKKNRNCKYIFYWNLCDIKVKKIALMNNLCIKRSGNNMLSFLTRYVRF